MGNITVKEFRHKKSAREIICVMDYTGWKVFYDKVEGRYWYWEAEKKNQYRELELGYLIKYSENNEPDSEDLVNGYSEGWFDIRDYNADLTGEFDDPIETSGPYIWQYGHFKFLGEDAAAVAGPTHLVDLTVIDRPSDEDDDELKELD